MGGGHRHLDGGNTWVGVIAFMLMQRVPIVSINGANQLGSNASRSVALPKSDHWQRGTTISRMGLRTIPALRLGNAQLMEFSTIAYPFCKGPRCRWLLQLVTGFISDRL